MNKAILLTVFFLTACGLTPTPNDFPPPPPMTPIVEFPQVTATTTIEPNLRPILPDNMQDAKTFFLILKTSMIAGDNMRIAESIKYPIQVNLGGQQIVLKDQHEFLDQYDKIFDQKFINAISQIDENNLILLPNGIEVGNGELWLNYYCVDVTCSDSHFLITQINK